MIELKKRKIVAAPFVVGFQFLGINKERRQGDA